MSDRQRLARYAAFADHHSANQWLALGWMPHPALERCYHGQFSVLVLWVCGCDVRRPAGETGRDKIGKNYNRNYSCDQRAVETQRDYDEEREFGWSVP